MERRRIRPCEPSRAVLLSLSLRAHRPQLDALVKALLSRETLDERKILELTGLPPAPALESSRVAAAAQRFTAAIHLGRVALARDHAFGRDLIEPPQLGRTELVSGP